MHGVVEEDDGHRLLQVDLRGPRALHRRLDPLAGPTPAGRAAPTAQRRRVLQADAAVAEVAAHAGEERLRGRPVHVDALGVREDELGEAERVLRPRLLPHVERPATTCARFSGVGGQRRRVLVAAGDDLQVLAGEVRGIAARAGDDLLDRDAVRRVPVGAEDHVLHPVDEDRRLVVEGLAHDDVHPQRLVGALWIGRPHPEERHVHKEVGLFAHLRQPAHPLHGELDLAYAVCDGRVELARVPCPITPSASRPCRRWKPLTASTSALRRGPLRARRPRDPRRRAAAPPAAAPLPGLAGLDLLPPGRQRGDRRGLPGGRAPIAREHRRARA